LAEEKDGMPNTTRAIVIKKPQYPSGAGKRSTFALYWRDKNGTHSKISDERLDAINKQLLAGSIDGIEAEGQVKRLKQQLCGARTAQNLFSKQNKKVLDAFFEAEYSTKDNVDLTSAFNDYRRAIEVLGQVPLASASLHEMQKLLKPFKATKQRRLATRLNSLLRYLGRSERLRLNKPELLEVSYLTASEVKSICAYLKPEVQILARFLYSSGCRVGEAMGIQRQWLRKRTLFVNSQIDGKGKRKPPKGGRARKSFVRNVDVIEPLLQMLPILLKSSRSQMTREFKAAALKAISKPAVLHDLRHSYAIELIKEGVPLKFVANSLGNSNAVCERYYVGYILDDESIDAIEAIVG
jgi:integrase